MALPSQKVEVSALSFSGGLIPPLPALCGAHLVCERLICASCAVVTDNDSQTLSEKDTLIVAIRATVSSKCSLHVVYCSVVQNQMG